MFQEEHPEQRQEPRERLTLPLALAGGPRAVTRDVSATGLFFVVDGEHVVHGPVEIELHLPEFAMRFRSSGEIVRIEHGDGHTGVAVRLVNPRLLPADGA